MRSRPGPPSVLITGRPVVILEDSLLARVLGHGEENDSFNFKPSVNSFMQPTILRPIQRHSLCSNEALITYQPEAVRNSAADCARQRCTSLLHIPVPLPQTSDTSISSTEDTHILPYNGGRHCLEAACRPSVPPYGASQFANLPIITPLDDVIEEELNETLQEECPSEGEPACTFTLQDNQTKKEPEAKISFPLETKAILNTPDTAQHCLQEQTISPEIPNLTEDDCDYNHQKMNNSVTSQHSIGERILKAWTDGIVTMSTKLNSELKDKHKACSNEALITCPESSKNSAEALVSNSVESSTESQTEDDSVTNSMIAGDFPIPKGNLPPLLLQPSRAVFAFEEREEHLLQDSDSELEMLPEHESQPSVSDSQTCVSLEENEPPRKEKALEKSLEKSVIVADTPPLPPPLPPPPPPPPPSSPSFQQSFLKTTMLSSNTDTAPEVGISTEKYGSGFDLHNLFGSQAIPIQPVRALPSLKFDPLSPLKLTPSLKLGLQKSLMDTGTPPQSNNTANEIKNTSNEESHHGQSSEPPSKKPRLLESDADAVIEGSVTSEHGTHAIAEDFTNANEMYSPPEISQVAKGPPAGFVETLTPIDLPKENPSLEAVVPVLSSPEAKLEQNNATSCYLFEQGQLEYPHEPSDNADDGLDTAYQAVPTECAREHALVPNMVPCRNEAGDTDDGRDHHDDPNGEHPIEVPVEQQIVSRNNALQSSEHLLDDRQTEVPCLEKQELLPDQHSTLELSQAPKLTETESNLAQDHTVSTCVNEYSARSPLTVDCHQLVPEDSLNSSFTTHSLYDHIEAVKVEQKSDLQAYGSLKDVDIDELDGPTVLSMALESIEARHKNVRFEIESPEHVSPEFPMHQWSSPYTTCQLNSIRTAPRYPHGKYIQVVRKTRCTIQVYTELTKKKFKGMSQFFIFCSLQILNLMLFRPHA